MSERKRVFLIGIPHFDWKLIEIARKEGYMKSFLDFLEKGSFGEIVPQEDVCSSPIEFTTIATGVRKEKHGIGFGEYTDREYMNGGRMYTRLDIKVKPIWDILQEYGKKIGIYHWLLTWPAKKVNGFMVTGRDSQDDENKTYPKELRRILWIEYPPEPDFFDPRAALMLIKKYDVDFFMGMEERIHGPIHTYWKYIVSENKKFRNLRENFFKLFDYVDSFLDAIEKEFPEAFTLIVSDSGNRVRESPIYTLGNETIELTKKLGIDLQFYAVDVYPPNLPKANPVFYLPRRNEKEKDRITKILNQIKLKNGKNFIENIKWDGDHLSFKFNFHPSLVNYKSGWLEITLPNKEKFMIWVTKQTGAPTPKDGVFVIKGNGIKKNFNVGKVKVEDITPTILALFSIPIPKWMDGKPLTSVKE